MTCKDAAFRYETIKYITNYTSSSIYDPSDLRLIDFTTNSASASGRNDKYSQLKSNELNFLEINPSTDDVS